MRSLVRSVRFRITAVAALAATIVLALAAGLLLVVQGRQLRDNLDSSLARRADALEAVVADLDPVVASDVEVLANSAGDDSVAQVVTIDGLVLAATGNAVDIGPIGPNPGDGDDLLRTVDALPVEDDVFRVLSRTIDGPLVIHVAQNDDDQREVVQQLGRAVSIVVPVAIAMLAAIVWWLVGRTLRPVESIRRSVADMAPDQLDQRVPQPGSGDEIDRLASTMNDLLDRLDDASRRQRRFVADASHELRSPLARMRTELETATPPTSQTADSVIEEIDEMATLVDDLLVLARSDSGRGVAAHRPVDLDDVVLTEVDRARTSSQVEIDRSSVSAAHVVGDLGELRRVVRNLLDNATRHATSRIEVSLGEVGDGGDPHVVLVVADDGPGIAPERADEVFDRFTRVDDSRSRDSGGTGLGLAIARDIVERHGGTLQLDGAGDDLGGARFVAVLPIDRYADPS